MANIPVAQIPNAPQTNSAAVPLPVGAIRTPNIELMPVIESQSYMAVGRAYENLGNAGQKAAGVLGDFALSMARASDEANLAAADRLKTDTLAKFQAEVATKPESEWTSIWENNYAGRLRDEVVSLPMATRDGVNRRDIWLANTENAIKADVFTKANKALVERGKQEMLNYVDRAVSEGRFEDGFAGLKRGEQAGYWGPEFTEAGMIKIEKETKWEAITAKVSVDPHTESSKLQQAVDNNKVHPDYPELLTQADRVKALRAARGFERENISRYSGEALERVLQGEFETKEDVRKAYTGLLPEKEIQTLEATLDQTPEAIQQRIELYRPVLALIEAYDPSTDPDLSQRMEIRQAIRQVETGFQRDLVDQLNEKVRQNKPLPPTSVNLIRKDLDSRFKAGEYGAWLTDKDGNPKNAAEREKYEAAMLAYGAEATAFSEWARRNPQATDEQAWGEINRIRNQQYMLNKAAGRDVPQPQTLKAPPSSQDVQDTLRRRGRGGRTPASVRNNNAGAMWYVGGWQNKFGAEYGQKLNDGLGQGNQIAKFPTPVHGAAALLYQLDRPSYRNSTVRGAIAKWSGGNNVGSYLKVLGASGFRPDQKVSDIMASPESALAFAQAMARHETGFDFPLDESGWQQAYDMYRNA